jgi:hypothetical protein
MSDIHQELHKIDRRTCLQGIAGTAVGVFAGERLTFTSQDPNQSPQQQTETRKTNFEPLTLAESLRLAGGNLLTNLNPEDNYLPYWTMTIRPDYMADFGKWWPAHNIGRWLDAMLRLEDAIGFEIPKAIETAMVENTRRFFDNPDHICLNPYSGPLDAVTDNKNHDWDLHSLREGLLALNALARWRKNDWAATMGRQMIQSIDGKLRDDGTWDLEKFDA